MVKKSHSDEMEAYERLLTDAMNGDAVLFVRQDAVETAWAIVEPILKSETPLYQYEQATWGPREAESLAGDVGGWHNPADTS